MLARMSLLPGWAGQALASASNGTSTGDISPILVRPCLAKDNTALGTVPAPGPLPTFAQALLITVPRTLSLGGTPRSLWNKRRALEPRHKEGAHQVSWPVTYNCCVRACTLAWRSTVPPFSRVWHTYLYLFLNLNLVLCIVRVASRYPRECSSIF